jgi:hypothetical protein
LARDDPNRLILLAGPADTRRRTHTLLWRAAPRLGSTADGARFPRATSGCSRSTRQVRFRLPLGALRGPIARRRTATGAACTEALGGEPAIRSPDSGSPGVATVRLCRNGKESRDVRRRASSESAARAEKRAGLAGRGRVSSGARARLTPDTGARARACAGGGNGPRCKPARRTARLRSADRGRGRDPLDPVPQRASGAPRPAPAGCVRARGTAPTRPPLTLLAAAPRAGASRSAARRETRTWTRSAAALFVGRPGRGSVGRRRRCAGRRYCRAALAEAGPLGPVCSTAWRPVIRRRLRRVPARRRCGTRCRPSARQVIPGAGCAAPWLWLATPRGRTTCGMTKSWETLLRGVTSGFARRDGRAQMLLIPLALSASNRPPSSFAGERAAAAVAERRGGRDHRGVRGAGPAAVTAPLRTPPHIEDPRAQRPAEPIAARPAPSWSREGEGMDSLLLEPRRQPFSTSASGRYEDGMRGGGARRPRTRSSSRSSAWVAWPPSSSRRRSAAIAPRFRGRTRWGGLAEVAHAVGGEWAHRRRSPLTGR